MKKILIVSLGRTGACVTYATEIINRIHGVPFDAYVSKHCQEKKPHAGTQITTYTNSLQFIFNSILVAPIYLVKTAVRLAAGKYDKVYFPYFHYWNIYFILLFKIFNKKVILTVHDGILHEGDGTIIEQYLNILSIKLADELIFLTDYVRLLVQEKIRFRAKYYVIPLGIIAPEGVNTTARKYKPKPTLLFFGRVNKYKGLENLIQAVSMLPQDVYDKLIIAGKFSYKLDVKDVATKTQVIDRFLTDDEIADVINTSDILIMPYKEASQSGVIATGIGGCIPMVVTDVGGLKEQLVDNLEAVFVHPDAQSIKTGILKLIHYPLLYENISINLKNKAEKLSWQGIADKVKLVIC